MSRRLVDRKAATGQAVAAALRQTLAGNKAILKSRANWAKLAGLSHTTVREAFEGANATADTLTALANAAGMELADMIQLGVAPADGIGAVLRAAAESLGMSDLEVARRLDISGARYGHYVRERNEPSIAMLRKICTVLHVSPAALLGFDDDGMRILPGEVDASRLRLAIAGAVKAHDLKLTDEEASRLADLAAVIYGRL
jgi:transcriptional regulator with XRE-family HTH domain